MQSMIKTVAVPGALTVVPTAVSVVLKPWQVDWAAYAGAQRTVRNIGKVKNTPDYDVAPETLQTDIEANTASCLCELATSILLNQRWNGPYWHPEHHKEASHTPDVGKNIEVRRTRTIGGSIPVFPQEAERRIQLVQAYISDEELQQVLAVEDTAKFETARVLLLGAIDAETAWEKGSQKYPVKRMCAPEWFYSVSKLLVD